MLFDIAIYTILLYYTIDKKNRYILYYININHTVIMLIIYYTVRIEH